MANHQPPASTGSAVELLTAWLDSPDGPPVLFLDCLLGQVEGPSRSENLAHAVELIMGFTYLSGLLLCLREQETGLTAQETLRHMALEYARTDR
jgi:hypothetical protein